MVLWGPKGKATVLQGVSGATAAVAINASGQSIDYGLAINASGQTVGQSGGHAVLWSPTGVVATVLQDVGGQNDSDAVAIK